MIDIEIVQLIETVLKESRIPGNLFQDKLLTPSLKKELNRINKGLNPLNEDLSFNNSDLEEAEIAK
jgi:hypothetical protein